MNKTALRLRVLQWANTNDDVRAVIETGAHARRDHGADELSDLDIELYLTDVPSYAARRDWFRAFGEVWVYLELCKNGFTSRLVIYEGGAKVDFILYDSEELKRRAQEATLPDIYQRGYVVHIDKDGLAAQIPSSPFAPPKPQPPTKEEFGFTLHEFWFEAYHIAKYLQRGELWTAKLRDRIFKDNLLKVMEWHALFVQGVPDVWFQGRFLREWTDAATWDELQNTFAHFGASDSWDGFFATLALFRRLATETALALRCQYPTALDHEMTGYFEVLRQQS